jgi:hypothetical protein
MTDAAQALEPPLRFVERTLAAQHALSDENGPMNDSRRGLAGYYRYNPRRLDLLIAPRGIARPLVHESVLRRIKAGQDAYAPIVLPPAFDVIPIEGNQRIESSKYLDGREAEYTAGRDRVFNGVWLRRVIYFATLGVTLALLIIPLVSEERTGCASPLCVVSPAIDTLDIVLPSFAAPWTAWYASRPELFIVLGGLALAGMLLGGLLQRAIFDNMRAVWYAMPKTKPDSVPLRTEAPTLSAFGGVLKAVRESMPYRAAQWILSKGVLPIASGVALLGVVAILANKGYYAARVAGGEVCRASGTRDIKTGVAEVVHLKTWESCTSTGLRVARGGTYEIELTIDEPWLDGGYPPNPDEPKKGLKADLRGVFKPSALLLLATPMKREFSESYLQPMARVGEKGTNVVALKSERSLPRHDGLTTLRSRFVAPASGDLFLYVNDAVGLPGDPDVYVRNNCGTAVGTIRLLAATETASAASASQAGELVSSPRRCR